MTTKKTTEKGAVNPDNVSSEQEISVESSSSSTAVIIASDESIPNLDKIMEMSSNLDKAEVKLDMTARYLEMSTPGDKFRGVYLGDTTISVTDQSTGEVITKKAVRLLNDKKIYLNAGVTLVREFNQAGIKPGTPVEIEYRSKEGKVKIYSVSLLG